MNAKYCKISLKKLTAQQNRADYLDSEVLALFGTNTVSLELPFTRAEFYHGQFKNTQGMSIPGVQEKLSLRLSDNAELVTTVNNGRYILKPSPDSHPFAAENEHAAMLVSKAVGIPTATCGLVTFKGGDEHAYIVERFDRDIQGNKEHQEDLVQCFGLPSEEKYSKTYEEAGQLLSRVTSNNQATLLDFVNRIMLAYVIGNDDLHLKNFSVRRTAGSKNHFYDCLTPNYDFLFCQAFPQPSQMGYLGLGLLHDAEGGGEEFTPSYEHYGYYTGADFIELGCRIGLPEKQILDFIAVLVMKKEEIVDIINRSYMPHDMKVSALKLVNERIKALQITRQIP
jgi:serine/threonine-protein kinase HipA